MKIPTTIQGELDRRDKLLLRIYRELDNKVLLWYMCKAKKRQSGRR